jgi:hypothetical protein
MQHSLLRQITRRYIGEDVSIFRAMFVNKPAIEKVQQNARHRQPLETAYQQTCGAISALYEFAPPEEGEGAETANQNGQVVEDELVEA